MGSIPKITIPPRPADYRIVYHLYIVFAEQRNELLEYCLDQGIEAKVHYPIPIYRQEALEKFGSHERFPVTDRHAESVISFPCDQHLSNDEIDFVISTVAEFYSGIQ